MTPATAALRYWRASLMASRARHGMFEAGNVAHAMAAVELREMAEDPGCPEVVRTRVQRARRPSCTSFDLTEVEEE